jgi:predicted 3-demethylubiquinone-9 3-methyltransferase (glyoxalase superfamily)
MTTVSTFLWLHEGAQDAATFYAEVFGTGPAATDPMSGTVSLPGTSLILFNGGPMFTQTEAASLFVSVETQDELDRYWDALCDDGQPGRCGWLKDRFGVSWQIVPTALQRLLGDPDRERAGRAQQAMMGMSKLVIAELEAAHAG